ncbi:MAG: hypothetical protein LCI00_09110 [Chloroflexi bacterium]|nr:hypothetical protein [Chloroflexota bacterium]MCC6893118.1 hypothetical protein [Anaerolineae bacterium]
MMADKKSERKGNEGQFRLNLVGFKQGEEQPRVVLQAIGEDQKAFFTEPVKDDGSFALSADVLKRAHRIVLGTMADDAEAIHHDSAVVFRPAQFAQQLADDGVLSISRNWWERWYWYTYCVSGHVRHCRRRPWWFNELHYKVTQSALETSPLSQSEMFSFEVATPRNSSYVNSLSELIYWPFRCDTICYGTVEVYRRTCCCEPWIIDDPRLPDLIRDLERIVEVIPQVVPGKIPQPPPPPPEFDKMPYFKGGSLDELSVFAVRDLQVLRNLPQSAIAEYINAREYLLCRFSCSKPRKVATGDINPDGTFNICWSEFPRRIRPNCDDRYAYVVKQTIGGTTTTVYDGVAANIWFSADADADLVSYSPKAFSCSDTGHPDGQAYVYLDLVGGTEAWQLNTPASAGWDRVALPGGNSGLLFPAGDGNGVADRNLGGTVLLTFNFSEGMKQAAVGAKYYRVSISEANANGEPTGSRSYYQNGLSWQKAVMTSSGLDIVPEVLGPFTVNGVSNLYTIPYDSNADWTGGGRYHAAINTNDFADKQHLITLEVFDTNAARLRPTGTAPTGEPGTEIAKPFKFRRWFQAGGSPGDDTVEVPFGAMTHLFWWDNGAPYAKIDALVRNGVVFNYECLFFEGSANSTFGIQYHAYVPNPMFQYHHTIGWGRGLYSVYGGTGTLLAASNANVGYPDPPAPGGFSPTNTFAEMLDTASDPGRNKCSFVVNLTTYAKTTNGDDLSYPYATSGAAFALEINQP